MFRGKSFTNAAKLGYHRSKVINKQLTALDYLEKDARRDFFVARKVQAHKALEHDIIMERQLQEGKLKRLEEEVYDRE